MSPAGGTAPALRVGLTMRQADALDYAEPRDALARDWWAFMAFALPEARCLAIPNLGADTVAFAEDWRIDAVVLTGGDDLGRSPERDASERALLDWCAATGRPVFGVCRGLQLLHDHHGGRLAPIGSSAHVARRHALTLAPSWARALAGAAAIEVNSDHQVGIRHDALTPPWAAFAETDDGWVEGLRHAARPQTGVMWHPERERPYRAFDRRLLRDSFGLAPA